MPNNKARKQFAIKDISSCKIYLRKIITAAEKCRYQLSQYLEEGKKILQDHKNEKTLIVQNSIYEDTLRRLNSVECYVLNVFGDMQTSSVSYAKFRKQVEKLERKGTCIGLSVLSEDEKETLKSFTIARNFTNHIPEALVIAEQELIQEGKAIPETEDPLEVYLPAYVTIEYYEDMIKQYQHLYEGIVELIGSAMKDYSALYGKEIELKIVHTDNVIGMSKLEIGKRAAQAQ